MKYQELVIMVVVTLNTSFVKRQQEHFMNFDKFNDNYVIG